MKKSKLLTSLMATVSSVGLITPVITTATSCSQAKDYTKIATVIYEEAVRIFKDVVCSVRHKSYDCKKAFDLYKEFVKNELKDVESEHNWVEDTYQEDWKKDHPDVPESKIPFKSTYSNAYFEIPATKGCENWERIIFQGHYDMVEDGFAETDTKIDVEEADENGRKILHVKDNRTSLGTDDGQGVALMLALLTKRNEFTHGPIRCFLVADEEPGMIGAKYLPNEWIDANYLMNIDNETEGGLVKSCAGGYSMNYYSDDLSLDVIDSDPERDNFMEFKLSGLKKSHSAFITSKMCNAAKELAWFLNKYYSQEYDSKIVKFETPDTDIDATNAVPVTATATIATHQSYDETICDQYAEAFQKYIRETYPDEKDALFTIKPLGTKSEKVKCIKTVPTKAFYQCLCDLKFGPISYLDTEKTILESSSSMGPICLNLELEETQKEKGYSPLMIKFYSRSCNNDLMDLIKAYNEKCFNNINSGFATVLNKRTLADFPGWAPEENNQIIDWTVEGYKNIGINPKVEIIHGGVEPTWWVNKHEGLSTSSIGPTIVGCHTAGEKMYLDTYFNLAKVVMSLLDKMAK